MGCSAGLGVPNSVVPEGATPDNTLFSCLVHLHRFCLLWPWEREEGASARLAGGKTGAGVELAGAGGAGETSAPTEASWGEEALVSRAPGGVRHLGRAWQPGRQRRQRRASEHDRAAGLRYEADVGTEGDGESFADIGGDPGATPEMKAAIYIALDAGDDTAGSGGAKLGGNIRDHWGGHLKLREGDAELREDAEDIDARSRREKEVTPFRHMRGQDVGR